MKQSSKIELVAIPLAIIILTIAISFNQDLSLAMIAIALALTIGLNIVAKKIVGYHFEIFVHTKLWSLYQYGFRSDSHFKKPLPMAWLPLFISAITRGGFWWLPILEFDISPRTERIARRHGLYRFTQVTEWHTAWIVVWGIIANIVLAVVAYISGYELVAKISASYALWSVIPLSSLDGSKILFGNKGLWAGIATISTILFVVSLSL